jgi:hypothetical protein
LKKKVTSMTKMRTVQTICEIPPIKQGIKFVIEMNAQIEEIPKARAPARA